MQVSKSLLKLRQILKRVLILGEEAAPEKVSLRYTHDCVVHPQDVDAKEKKFLYCMLPQKKKQSQKDVKIYLQECPHYKVGSLTVVDNSCPGLHRRVLLLARSDWKRELSDDRTAEAWLQYVTSSTHSESTLHTSKFHLDLNTEVTPAYSPKYKNPCWETDIEEEPLMCTPYLYLAGFPKCGTTDLYYRLTLHPLVHPSTKKETHFIAIGIFANITCPLGLVDKAHTSCKIYTFSHQFYQSAARDIANDIKITNVSDWKSSMYNSNSKKQTLYLEDAFPNEMRAYRQLANQEHQHPFVVADGSTGTAMDFSRWRYISDNAALTEPSILAPDIVLKINPKAKVVFILRNPISRSYSDYLYFTKENSSAEDFHSRVQFFVSGFEDCLLNHSLRYCAIVEYRTYGKVPKSKAQLTLSLYHVFINEWLQRMPRKNLLVMRFEDYRANMTRELTKLFHFLEFPPLPSAVLKAITAPTELNQSKYKDRVGPMLLHTERLLSKFFQPHNDRLALLLQDPAFTWAGLYH